MIHCISKEASMRAEQFCVFNNNQQQNLGRRFSASTKHLSPPPPPPPPMAYAAVRSKAVVLSLLIYCLMYFPLLEGVLCLSLFCYALLCVHSSFEGEVGAP